MKSKTLGIIICFVAIFFNQETNAVEMRGMISCGRWINDKKNDELSRITAERWIIGYLSGLAAGTEKNILEGTDNDSIILWIDNYCSANPLKDIGHGSNEIFFELARQKRL